MKIVFLLQASSLSVRGGTEFQTDLIMNEAAKTGHRVICVSDLLGNPGPGRKDIEYRYLKGRGRKFSLLNFFQLIKELKRIDPDIIYQRWRIAYTGMAAWFARKHGRKMVFGIANMRDPRKNRVPLDRMFLFKSITEYLGRYGIRHADAVVAQTYEQRETLRQQFHRDSCVIRTGHPVPSPPFPKAMPPLVIWVSNIKPVKRFELFLDLARECRDLPARFVHVGGKLKNSYQDRLDDKAKDLNNVQFLGELPFEETNDWIARSAILVNTSASEGFPNTFVQAWLRETPVVSFEVDPDRLLVEEGLGYCSGTFERLVADVRALLEDEDKRRPMGEKAREYAVRNHDIARIGKQYIQLFERLAGAE
jgi:glycosyltransferase involved in cell wall biosynthesis